MSLEERLAQIEAQASAIHTELARPEVHADPAALRRLGRELARLEPVVDVYGRLKSVRTELDGARQVRDHESEPELREMARDEVDRLEA
ncbi:MAG TPA: PCRF domain-containing protein, partial [Candidatus Limnocylindrales bacterium]